MAKKTTKRAAGRTKTAPKASTTSKKITPAKKARTKGELYTAIAEATELSRKQVAAAFDAMARVIAADLGKAGPGQCNVAGLMKVVRIYKPATKARKGINPFTKEETTFKAKPARNIVKIRALRPLKSMV